MTQNEQVNAFKKELEKVIDRFAEEFDLSIAEAIGVLHLLIFDLQRMCQVLEDEK